MVFLAACGSGNQQTGSAADDVTSHSESNKGQAFIADDGSTPTILQIALNSEDHTTLVAAVQAAEQENALANAGPLFTGTWFSRFDGTVDPGLHSFCIVGSYSLVWARCFVAFSGNIARARLFSAVDSGYIGY